MTPTQLTLIAALSGGLHIYFDYTKNIKATYLFKPLVCATLITLVYFFGSGAPDTYRNLVIAGLFFSMLGDICLMLKNEKFVQGLIAFLLAHILYIVAFSGFINFDGSYPWGLFFLLFGVAFFVWRYLYASLAEMNIPVIVYICAITLMCASAGTWLFQGDNSNGTFSPAILAFVGSLWFMASDTNLSINKFKQPYAAAQAVTLATYYIAQILIAWSVLIWV